MALVNGGGSKSTKAVLSRLSVSWNFHVNVLSFGLFVLKRTKSPGSRTATKTAYHVYLSPIFIMASCCELDPLLAASWRY